MFLSMKYIEKLLFIATWGSIFMVSYKYTGIKITFSYPQIPNYSFLLQNSWQPTKSKVVGLVLITWQHLVQGSKNLGDITWGKKSWNFWFLGDLLHFSSYARTCFSCFLLLWVFFLTFSMFGFIQRYLVLIVAQHLEARAVIQTVSVLLYVPALALQGLLIRSNCASKTVQ